MTDLTEAEMATVRVAAQREADRCNARAAEHDAEPGYAAHAAWWRATAVVWLDSAERRIAEGRAACQGWAGVNLNVEA